MVDVPTGSAVLTTAATVDEVEVSMLVPTAGLSAAPRTAMATIMATVRIPTPTMTQKSLRRLKRGAGVRPCKVPGVCTTKSEGDGSGLGDDSPGAPPSTL